MKEKINTKLKSAKRKGDWNFNDDRQSPILIIAPKTEGKDCEQFIFTDFLYFIRIRKHISY